jgi:hypothetical protein
MGYDIVGYDYMIVLKTVLMMILMTLSFIIKEYKNCKKKI